jgi:protocatechuate 3,4-dioxygenase beta subunit
MRPAEFYQRDRTLHPPALHPGYKTSVARSPRLPLLTIRQTASEITGPTFGHDDLGPLDNDLTMNFDHGGMPVGERMVLHGRVLDENSRPVPRTLVEIWQANASGRYRHKKDAYLGALDPNFRGCGRTLTDDGGYSFFRTKSPAPTRG